MFRPHSTPAVPNRIAGVFSFGSPALSIWRSSGNKNDPRNSTLWPYWLEAACRPVFWGSRAKNLFPDKSFNAQKPLELQGPHTLIFRLFPDISLGGRLAVPPNGRFATRAVKSAVRMEVSPLSRLWLLDWRALQLDNILAFLKPHVGPYILGT